MDPEIVLDSVLLGTGALSTIVLIICLAHTWRRWTQLKWYVLMVAVGCGAEVVFTMALKMAVQYHGSLHGGVDAACKLIGFLMTLGPSFANMALSAMSVHVLLTALTGSQGSGTRHGVIIGIFALLSLPLPMSRIAVLGVRTFEYSDNSFCMYTDTILGPGNDYRLHYTIAESIAVVFFPLIVIVGALGGAYIYVCAGTRGKERSENNTAEVVFATVLATMMLVCCVPIEVMRIHFKNEIQSEFVTIFVGLMLLFFAKTTLVAVACVVFGYAYVYRKGEQAGLGNTQPTIDHGPASERTKLVN